MVCEITTVKWGIFFFCLRDCHLVPCLISNFFFSLKYVLYEQIFLHLILNSLQKVSLKYPNQTGIYIAKKEFREACNYPDENMFILLRGRIDISFQKDRFQKVGWAILR